MGASPPRSGGEGVPAGASPARSGGEGLPGVLTAFCPKRKIAFRNLERGNFHLPPIAASDSRHDLSQRTTVSRGAARRVGQRVLARREAAGRRRVCLTAAKRH